MVEFKQIMDLKFFGRLIATFLVFGGLLIFGSNIILAETNIVSSDKWAWNNALGWIDLYNTADSTKGVVVGNLEFNGWGVFAAGGELSFNCATSSDGDTCTTVDYKVTNTVVVPGYDGKTGGWAWSDAIGWISFSCENTGTCGTVQYQPKIRNSDRNFFYHAWSDAIGWISFNCESPDDPPVGTCGDVDYRVKTSWNGTPASSGDLTSVTYDTKVGGVNYNSIIWKGDLGQGTVKFQLATSNCSNGATNSPTCDVGAWSFKGPDNTIGTYYEPSSQGVPVPIVASNHTNERYYRYKIFIVKNAGGDSPVVEDVVVNWSP